VGSIPTALTKNIKELYPVYATTRKVLGSMTRKLSVIEVVPENWTGR
jgi:hypothetical protein